MLASYNTCTKAKISCLDKENGVKENKREGTRMIDGSAEISELRKNSNSLIIKELDSRDEMD
jgi:hypothetical protein